MSIGNEDLFQILQPGETNPTSSRQSKVSYTRKFLLSLSDLEICKRLPKGLDESLLRCNDYSSSPPEKGETGNFSRGVDRWDNRASGRSDTDSHSDRDSDSGRRYGTQFRRPWQNPEHDGLLGSGSLPRPPGFRPATSLPNSRANDQPHLKKSSDPYHPPRPFKAAPHSRRETKDSYNDETFGWGENSSEDRSEEEIKRRAEFEMMRKEQRKELQQKMKSKVDKLKDDPMTELAASLDSGGEVVITNELDTSVIKPLQQNDSGKNSVSSQGHQIRPLVPPGFANAAAVEKFSGPKFLEVGKHELGHGNNNEKPTPIGLGYSNCEITSSFASKGETRGLLTSSFELSSKTTDSDDHSFRAPNISETSDVLRSVNIGKESENLNGLNVMGETGHSTSILEKLFGGALSSSSSSPLNTIEDQNMKSDDAWSPKDSQFQTSKFVHLFLEEEKKSAESGRLEKSNELLYLIGGEKSGLLGSETKPAEQRLTPQSNLVKWTTPTPNDAAEVLCSNTNKKPETVSAFLTCEDLEQSILSNVGESSSSSGQPPRRICMEHEAEKADTDKNASQHLLSLLQMGTSSSVNSKNMLPPLEDKGNVIRGDEDAENVDSGKGLTLETLFGTAFMKELKSADAPQMNSCLPLLGHESKNNMEGEVGVNLGRYGMRLPEEDSLTSSNAQMFPSALGVSRSSRQLFDMVKPEVVMHAQSPPQFMFNDGRPMLHHLDHQDAARIHQQFPANDSYRRHPGSGGLSEFDHNPMLLLQQQPPNNLVPGFQGAASYIHDHNNLVHPSPFRQHHPNLGMRLGHGDTNNQPPPQALQRILEMELRSSQKPMHHPGSGHSQSRPLYGHELDAAGLWYR